MDPISRIMASATSIQIPTYSLSRDLSSVDEGQTLTISVTTTNVQNSTTLYWSITQNPGDFGVSQGTVTINNNSGSFTVTPTADNTVEGAETFDVRVYTDSSCTVEVASITNITINDTSPAARYVIYKYHAYGSAMGTVDVYLVVGTTANLLASYGPGQSHSSTTAAWSSASHDISNYAGQNVRLAFVMDDDYTNYQSDFALDEIKYTSSTGTVTNYAFDTSSDIQKWAHTGYTNHASTSSAALGTHASTLSTSGNNMIWLVDPGGGTTSSGTGPSSAANGSSTKNYLYFEASVQSGITIVPCSVRLNSTFVAN